MAPAGATWNSKSTSAFDVYLWRFPCSVRNVAENQPKGAETQTQGVDGGANAQVDVVRYVFPLFCFGLEFLRCGLDSGGKLRALWEKCAPPLEEKAREIE